MRRVVITGLGVITPIGNSKTEFWDALSAGKSGIVPISRFDASSFPVRIAGEVKNLDCDEIYNKYPEVKKFKDRKIILGLRAFEEALKDSSLSTGSLKSKHVTLNTGVALEVLPIEEFVKYSESKKINLEDFYKSAFYGKLNIQTPLDTTNNLIVKKYSVKGPCFINCSACAASTQAVGHSARLIRTGVSDIAFAGGFDSMVNPLGIGGFSLLGALSVRNDSPETASRPFDAYRDGAVLGEGAGILVLEELEHALKRKAKIYCEISGFGSSLDAYKPTDPDPEGYGAFRAMKEAIESAEITAGEIDYINAHGTSTPKNDEIETMAIKKVFCDHAKEIPISAVKSMIGHLIAASGAVELIASIIGFERNLIPPTINYKKPDPFCDLDYTPNTARPFYGNFILKNSFGFGGQNASVVLKRWDEK
jgi:3-oxoacyl-[acyl-carrier-protein] synthase II